jgi:hypothetical protein
MTQNALTPDTAQVGDGTSVHMFSDSQSFTIVDVLRNGRQIVLQRDSAVRSNQSDDTFSPGGFAGHTESPKGQLWDITPDPDGATVKANWSAKRDRFFVGGPKGRPVTAGSYERYDYNF